MRKWLTASVADDPADVIKCVFDQAEARDPEHRRTWIVLVDGATAQIDAISAEAAKRNAPIHIVIDFIHVLQYLHQAACILHGDGDNVAVQDAGEHALAVLTGRDEKVADELAAATATRPDADGHKKIGETVTYPRNQHDYLRYDTALPSGWPIAPRRDRGRLPPSGRRQTEHHRSPLVTGRRRSRPQTPCPDLQRRHRNIPGPPPGSRHQRTHRSRYGSQHHR